MEQEIRGLLDLRRRRLYIFGIEATVVEIELLHSSSRCFRWNNLRKFLQIASAEDFNHRSSARSWRMVVSSHLPFLHPLDAEVDPSKKN